MIILIQPPFEVKKVKKRRKSLVVTKKLLTFAPLFKQGRLAQLV